MKSRLQWLIPIAAFTWLFAIILSYYVTHKPFDPVFAVHGVLAVWRVLIGLAVVAIAGGIGRLVFPLTEQDPLIRISLQSALGLGILALGIMIVGSTIGLHPVVLYLSLPVLAGLFYRRMRAWLGDLRDLKRFAPSGSRFQLALAIVTGAILFFTLIHALAPPIEYDALVYHLTIPEEYLRQGRVTFIPWLEMSGMPQTAEMLYTWAIALGGRPAAATLGWLFSILAAVGIFGYLQSRLGKPAAWVGTAALFGGFSLALATAWAYVDWLTLLFGFGCLVALESWRIDGDRKLLVLAGLFAGLGFATKYTAGMLALIGVGAVGWHAWKRKEAFLPAVIRFGLAAAVFAIPWLAKNWLSTGNPIYPFLFPQSIDDVIRLNVFQNTTPFGDWTDILFLPFRATYLGIEDKEGYSFSPGPLFLGLGAIAFLARRRIQSSQKAFLENAVVFTLLGLLIWIVGNQLSGYLIQTRMYFPVFPAFAALTAVGYQVIADMRLPTVRIGRLAAILILLVLFLNFIEVSTAIIRARSLPAVLGIDTEKAFIANNLGWYQNVVEAIDQLPEESKVQFLFETRGLYCAPKCQSDAILAEWKVAYHTHDSDQAIFANWRNAGITHVLVFNIGVDYFLEMDYINHTEAELNALKQAMNHLEVVQEFDEAYTLYRIP